MGSRLELHQVLVNILGTTNAYFQPPETIKMSYPCIVYTLDKIRALHAGNKVYLNKRRYTVTIIDKNPDSLLPEAMLALTLCGFDRNYKADNLNHYVFTLYY